MTLAQWKIYLALGMTLILLGCAQPSPPSASNRVQIDDSAWVSLPEPSELGYRLNASQLLTVSYHDNQQQQQTNQLPIQLQVTQDKVVLAGFSSWGTRLLSLEYQHQAIDTYVMAGLADTLPKPEQVLFNLMITLWPVDVWQPRLQPLGWQLSEIKNQTGKHRQLLNAQGQVVADIHYANAEPLKGDISFINHVLDFTIVIKTLQYQPSPSLD